MKLIVWLGNPWPEYAKTRHNIWFSIIESFCSENNLGSRSRDKKYNAEIIKAELQLDIFLQDYEKWHAKHHWEEESKKEGKEKKDLCWESVKIIFCKPLTYMNKSGEAIKKIADFYKIKPEDILVIHDDIDLSTGKIQKKVWGSHAGHNWLKSILQQLQNNNTFTRIRIWVDRPQNKDDVVEYVLQNFSKKEMEVIEKQEGEITWLINEFIVENI